jgi:hypothetical protein
MVNKRNLEGYKREDNRFIPPMKQLWMVREQSYVNDMLPEQIWLRLIHGWRVYRFVARLALNAPVATSGRQLHEWTGILGAYREIA